MLKAEKEQAAQVLAISGVDVQACVQCGKCSASCPAAGSMDILPHRFVNCLRNGQTERLRASKTLWKCVSCFACAARCPRGVDPARLIEGVRLTVIRRPGANHLTADDIPALLDERLPQQAIVAALRKYGK